MVCYEKLVKEENRIRLKSSYQKSLCMSSSVLISSTRCPTNSARDTNKVQQQRRQETFGIQVAIEEDEDGLVDNTEKCIQ